MRGGCLLSNGSAHLGSPSDRHTQHLIEWPGNFELGIINNKSLMNEYLKGRQKQKEWQCRDREPRFSQLTAFCLILSSFNLSRPRGLLFFLSLSPRFHRFDFLFCPLSRKYVRQPIPPNQDLVRLNWISQSLVPKKQVATGGLSALTTPWKLPAGPTQLPGVALEDDPAWKTEKTSATLNCVRGSDRYHCPEGCS